MQNSPKSKEVFDGLSMYAMSKIANAKKASTLLPTIGPSTTNPFIKLTIKKGHNGSALPRWKTSISKTYVACKRRRNKGQSKRDRSAR